MSSPSKIDNYVFSRTSSSTKSVVSMYFGGVAAVLVDHKARQSDVGPTTRLEG